MAKTALAEKFQALVGEIWNHEELTDLTVEAIGNCLYYRTLTAEFLVGRLDSCDEEVAEIIEALVEHGILRESKWENGEGEVIYEVITS
jgi:hypothetical protein